jgi:hypothetical protein
VRTLPSIGAFDMNLIGAQIGLYVVGYVPSVDHHHDSLIAMSTPSSKRYRHGRCRAAQRSKGR